MVHSSRYIAINSFVVSDEMWCLTADPVVGIPVILTEFPQGKHCGSFFKKHNFDEKVQLLDISHVFFGLPAGFSGTDSRAHSGGTPFHPRQTSSWSHFPRAHTLPATPFQCTRSRTATLELVAAALTCPYVGLTVHRTVRPAGDPVESDPEPSSRTIPTLDQALVACLSPECVATPGSRRFCPF